MASTAEMPRVTIIGGQPARPATAPAIPAGYDTPLGRLVLGHAWQQCTPFTDAYNRAVELGVNRMDAIRRRNLALTCHKTVVDKFETACAPRVVAFQNALAAAGTEPTAQAQAAVDEAKGRLLYCTRYPHPLNRDEVNPRPVSWYFKNKDGEEATE